VSRRRRPGIGFVGGWLDEQRRTVPLNDGLDQLRVLIEDEGFEHSGILVEDEHPPDAITVSLSDTTEWTITMHRQRSSDER
jgi:hypothetical protein